MIAIAEEEIVAHTALLAETTSVAPDYSGGAALGALVAATQRGEIEQGSRVVLVVTGTRPEPAHVDLRTIEPDADDVLTALGLHS